mgnify:CR=1 FL=1
MARHSFIQMSKLPNVKGRISYITSHARQENLYATYRTADNEFWSNLARESQQEFKRSGTESKCIEARELIIALPEVYTKYEPQEVLEDFTEEFHRRYGVECVSALHHNKRKTNYHIHLIFSERKLLPEPDIKIATRSVFYDETGKRVRTKKEITGEDGQIRKGCTVIKKGEIYESHLFTVKDDKFKSEPFLREVKEIYTDLINRHISDPEQQLKVFDKNSVYLPTKKIGKNNPKAAEIEADNTARQEWNRTADMALLSGISEAKILEVKQTEIHEKASQSIKSKGWLPNLFRGIVAKAKDFLQKAFSVILVATVVVWFLQSFNLRLNMVSDSSDSMLAMIAQIFVPILTPLGLGDWRIATALISGVMAKESVVSTLEVLFSGSISTVLSPLTAGSLLVFSLLYTPCIAAIASVKRELGSKWAVSMVIWQCIVAWVAAFAVYLIGGLL